MCENKLKTETHERTMVRTKISHSGNGLGKVKDVPIDEERCLGMPLASSGETSLLIYR